MEKQITSWCLARLKELHFDASLFRFKVIGVWAVVPLGWYKFRSGKGSAGEEQAENNGGITLVKFVGGVTKTINCKPGWSELLVEGVIFISLVSSKLNISCFKLPFQSLVPLLAVVISGRKFITFCQIDELRRSMVVRFKRFCSQLFIFLARIVDKVGGWADLWRMSSVRDLKMEKVWSGKMAAIAGKVTRIFGEDSDDEKSYITRHGINFLQISKVVDDCWTRGWTNQLGLWQTLSRGWTHRLE